VESQYVKFLTNLIYVFKSYPGVVDCCYLVMWFLSEMRKPKLIYTNFEQKSLMKPNPWQFGTENRN